MRRVAALLATLCLNFAFWHDNGNALWLPFSKPVTALVVPLIAAAFAALFFAGPALAVHRNKSGLFATVESALGPIPTHLVRFCALWYLVDWVSGFLARIGGWMPTRILDRDPSATESALLVIALLAFLTATSHEPSLARFSIRLSLAILIAAAIRVRETPAYFTGAIETLEWSLNSLALAVAPMAFLSAHLAATLPTARQVIATSAVGLALPLWVSTYLVGLVNMATLRSHYYKPSLAPSIEMALMGSVSRVAIPALMLIIAVSLFGPMRLGIQLLRNALHPILGWLGLLAIAAFAIHTTLTPTFLIDILTPSVPATILAATAAILTAGLLTPPTSTRFDIPANLALLAGSIVGLHNIHEPELLPAYATALVLTLAGRKVQSILRPA